jgi:sarcosine oxidase subunit beta
MTQTADVIVVGAGVHGASIAFHLTQRGARVIVVERSVIGAGATGRSSGLVRMHYDLLAETRLAWAAFPYFLEWAERVGGDCGFTRTGFVWIESADEADRLRTTVADHRALGIDAAVVDADDIRRLAPALRVADDEIAAYEPESGYADPTATATGFLRAARERGATLVQGAEVAAIPVTGGRVTGVETTKGSFSAPVVVNAAGAWAARVAAFVGLDIPVTTWRHDTGYLGAPAGMPRPLPVVIDNPGEQYLRPEGEELVLIGLEDHNELGGSPDRDTAEAEAGFQVFATERIVGRVPSLIDATFRSAHAGQDGLTPDQRCILGQAGPDGFYLDCGHSGTGFKTSPSIGLAISELILDGAARSSDITPFALERFERGEPLAGEHGGRLLWR